MGRMEDLHPSGKVARGQTGSLRHFRNRHLDTGNCLMAWLPQTGYISTGQNENLGDLCSNACTESLHLRLTSTHTAASVLQLSVLWSHRIFFSSLLQYGSKQTLRELSSDIVS